MRPRVMAAVVAGMATSALMLSAPSQAAIVGSTSPSDDFESGTLHAWSSTKAATATASAALHGNYGAQISVVKSAGYLTWSSHAIQQGHGYATFRAYVEVVSHASGQSVNLFTIENSNHTNNFDFFVSGSSGRFRWDLRNADSAQSGFTVQMGRWYLVEVQCEFSGSVYNARVRIDGVDQTSVSSSGQTPATVRSLWVGGASAKTHVTNYDDVALQVGDTWLGFLGGV